MSGWPPSPCSAPPRPLALDEAWARVSKLHQPNLPLRRAGLLPSPTPCFSFNCLVQSPAHVGGAFWPFLLSFVSLIHSTQYTRHSFRQAHDCFCFLLLFFAFPFVDLQPPGCSVSAPISTTITSRVRSPYLVPDRVCPRHPSSLRLVCQCLLRRGAASVAFRIRSGPGVSS